MTTPGPRNAPPPTGRGWAGSTLLGVVLFAVYLANGREIGTYDTHPTSLLPLVILRGEGRIWTDSARPCANPEAGCRSM